MKRISLILFLMIFLLIGCKNIEETNEQLTIETVIEGIYYGPLESRLIEHKYNSLSSYGFFSLGYDDRIYTSVYVCDSEEKEQLNLNSVFGRKLNDVYGNHEVFWSVDKEILFECNGTGELYEVKGYDSDFCVGIYYDRYNAALGTSYYTVFFYKLNDIYMKYGKELFVDRLHLQEAIKIEAYDMDRQYLCDVTDDEIMKDFLNIIGSAEFIDPLDEECKKLDSSNAYKIVFYDEVGIKNTINLYEEGYVYMDFCMPYKFAVKIEEEYCRELIERFEKVVKEK